MLRLRLGTRGSALALTQSRDVAARLKQANPGLEIEERIIETGGDRSGLPLGASDERGVFVRQIEEALLEGRVDLAVHSMKDLPTSQPEGLAIASVPLRHDARDAILSVPGHELEGLPQGARLGTGSPRRRAQILHARPDLQVAPLRGNIDTRVRKLAEGGFDALVLAMAGIGRLGIRSVGVRPIPFSLCVPAVGQGALALETRSDDARALQVARSVADPDTTRAVLSERAFLRRLGGGCLAPAGAHARIAGGAIEIEAAVGDPDGRTLLRERVAGEAARGEALAEALAARLLERGASEILERIRAGGSDA